MRNSYYWCLDGKDLIKIYDELGWVSLIERRYCRRISHFYKIQNKLTPAYMKDPLPLPKKLIVMVLGVNMYFMN